MVERYQLTSQAARDVQAYVEYHNIMGDHQGPLLSNEQFDQHKQQLQKNIHKRVYGQFLNSQQLECKSIGPASKCFCDHRFKEHNHTNPVNTSKVNCQYPGCSCKCFTYIPVKGSQDLKCNCKHSYSQHDANTKKCKEGRCQKTGCTGFRSSWGCGCGDTFDMHYTLFESYQERVKKGKPVGDGLNPFPGGFMALADGIDKQEMIMGGGGGGGGHDMIKGGGNQGMIMGGGGGDQVAKTDNQMTGMTGMTAFDLYNTPHNYGTRGTSQKQKRILAKY